MKSIFLFLALYLNLSIIVTGQSLPPKVASPINVLQIHSGHSLTDPLFHPHWPGQYVNLMGHINNIPSWQLFDVMVGKSTGPGSTIRYRWENPLMYSPDARLDIDDWQLLSITERVPLLYEGGSTQQWYLDGIDEQREYLSLFVNNAWNNGNNGNGVPTLLWTTWVHVDNSSGNFRSLLDIQGGEWEAMQDYANANRPSGAPPVYIIPGHKMMARLYDDIQAGLVPGITNINQFFSDNIHTNELGAYAISMINYACIFNTSPVGLPNDLLPSPPPGTPIPSPALAAYLQNMIWEVVTSYPRTGIYTSPVIAVIDADNSTGTAPLTVSFDGSQSVNTGSGSLTYSWNFGDGSPVASGQNVNHIFQSSGIYTVTLTVSDSNSNTDTATEVITVTNPSSSNTCTYLAYEGFDYVQNIPLHGRSGGEGFSANWMVQGDNTDVPGFQVANSSSSLVYSNLQTDGSHASGGRSYLASGRRLNTSPTGPFSDYVLAGNQTIGAVANGNVMWMSVLVNKPQNDNDEVYVELHSADLAWCNLCPDVQRVGVGYYGTSSNVGGQKRWSLSIGSTIYPSTVPMVAGTTALLVLRLTFNASGTQADLFVNPVSLGDNDPGSPQVAQTTSTPYQFRSVTFYGGPIPGKGLIDEWRMAALYKCVAPDPSILFNIPPVAVINATPSSGMAPLVVNFDGSSSINNEGGTLSYVWDFGDGSPLSTQVNTTHTYLVGGGQVTATLTVTDANNNSNSATQEITLLDENGTFSCQTSITAVSQAACNGTGGHLIIHTVSGTTPTLMYNNTTINPTTGNNYTNLLAGNYQLDVIGSNGCSDHYLLSVPIDSSKCPGWQPADCAMEIGTNLPGFADWEPHRAMRNFMKNTRGEAIPYTSACNCWSFGQDTIQNIFSQMDFDADGYPTSLPQNTTFGNVMFRYFVSSEGRNMPPGQTYVLLYEGNGTFDISGTLTNVNQTSGRIQFTLGGDGTFWFQLTQSTLGNHVRNIRIVRLADEFADITNQPFYQGFVDKIAPFSVIRYMDWQHTNNNPMVQWSERPLLGRFSYGDERGVPYELIIQLANQTKKDIWICVPHAADDNFITQMATLFKTQLDPDLTIYLEYSNEVWNWIFSQANYNNDNRPFNLNYGRAMALKAKNTFDLWHAVFAGETCRVKRVLGIQAGFNYLNEQILAHLDQDDWDYGSPTHYFGLDHEDNGVPRLNSSSTVAHIMQNAQNNFNNFKQLIKQDYRNVQVFGKDVITYEGGQHFVGNVFGSPYPYQQAMWDAQTSPQMYQMYDMIHDSIRTWGCKLASNFSLAGPQESVYGSWGVMEDIDIAPPYMTTAPKYQALLDNMPSGICAETHHWIGGINTSWSNPCNWNKSRLPNEAATVIIPNNVANFPQVDINTQVKMVKLASNAMLTILTGYQLLLENE
jgi:PKD repeat protein